MVGGSGVGFLLCFSYHWPVRVSRSKCFEFHLELEGAVNLQIFTAEAALRCSERINCYRFG